MRLVAIPLMGILLLAPSVDAEQRNVVYNGFNLSYHFVDEAGSSAPTLVFIHGLACRSSHWEAQIEGLKSEARVLAVDLLGHGDSDVRGGAYTMDLFADNVAAVMDREGIDRAVLVGHSMGAAVARTFARNESERLQGIVAVDGFLYVSPETVQMASGFLQGFDGPDFEQRMKGMVESFFVEGTSDAIKQEVRDSMLGTTKDVTLAAMKGMYNPSVWAPLAIEVPVSAVMASSTPTPAGYEEQLRKEAPQLELSVIEGTGHFVMMERPDVVNDEIRKLLSRVEGD